ncbi:hypothetical protein D7Y26_08990 [Stenotrophomonas maltophilia]|nr:hypothetical protein [Stenotrophomonas maltophilia]MBA0323756.1 hypothetical protein [Stenotrophomonas maltophilia]
MEFHQAAGEVH